MTTMVDSVVYCDVVKRECADVPWGTLRIAVETPGSIQVVQYPVIDGIMSEVDRWNDGDREHIILSALYAGCFIEPYVTWAGELSWRVTADGKKAGLK